MKLCFNYTERDLELNFSDKTNKINYLDRPIFLLKLIRVNVTAKIQKINQFQKKSINTNGAAAKNKTTIKNIC